MRFANLSDQRFQNATRVFGPPDFLHRHWDRRALREIADGDVIVFAKGEADQPFVPFSGDDESYARPLLCGLDPLEFALIGAVTGGGTEFIRQRSPHQ